MSSKTSEASRKALPHVDFDSDALKVRLNLRFAADPAKLHEISDAIMKLIATMKCACGHEDAVEVALDEALANAIKHGAASDPSKQVECRVACDDQHGLLVVISDPGKGFKLEHVPDPLVGENLFSEHGRGIFLINQLMDHVEYRNGGTEIRMVKFPKKPVDKKTCGLG